MKMEIRLLRNFEISVGRFYDRVMFVARSEAQRFDQMLGEKKSMVAPLGVDYEFFAQDLSLPKKEKSIAFMGALNVAHNENGITYFINNCMPQILERVPEATLYIIGGGASEQLKQYSSKHVVFRGRVPDVRVAIGECEVFICPLQFGSGIKTKNLEAMAMGMPVVTTPIGAENIDAENGNDWFIAKTDEEFINAVVKLLVADYKLKEKIGDTAQKFVRNNFSWISAEEAFREVLLDE